MRRAAWLVPCCLFLIGCTTVHQATLPGRTDAPDEARVVEQGMQARVTLVGGEILTGEVTAVSAESVTLGKAGNFGWAETVIGVEDIARIETETDSEASNAIGASAGVLFVVALGLIILISKTVTIGST